MSKCIEQLTNRATRTTVLRAKKVILQFICRDYCGITTEELNKLKTKSELYTAAAAWVRV